MVNYVYIATSLDGYIATKDGGLDWLMNIPNPDKSDFGFAGFIESVDAIVMGRNTFEKVVSFGEWPYTKPVFVLSNALSNVPKEFEGKAEIINGELKQILQQLKEKGYKDRYIDGGKVIQSFLKEDLIDEMIITRVSVLLGSGIPLFGKMMRSLKFEHIETKVLTKDLVQSRYKRA